MSMENIVGQPHNQLVCNRANSSGKGPAHWKGPSGKYKNIVLELALPVHLENTKIQIKYMMVLSAFNFTLPLRAERHGHTLQTANRFSVFTI